MNAALIQDEIKEMNLSYLMLAQQMIQHDRAAAIFRLGIDNAMATMISTLTPAQLLKLSGSSMLLCQFRVDGKLLQTMLSNFGKGSQVSQQHAALLLAHQPVEEFHA